MVPDHSRTWGYPRETGRLESVGDCLNGIPQGPIAGRDEGNYPQSHSRRNHLRIGPPVADPGNEQSYP